MDWLLRRKYLVLLIVLAGLVVLYPVLYDFLVGLLLLNVLITALYLASFLAVFSSRKGRFLAVLLGGASLIGNWTSYTLTDLPRQPLGVVLHALAAVYLAVVMVLILVAIYREKTVTSEDIFAALCAYLFLCLIFGHLYCILVSLNPNSFRSEPALLAQLQDERHQRFLLTYFSMVTITTLGYGDLVPATGPARGLAMIEAVLGQFYVAVLIAELVGRRAAQVPAAKAPEQKS